MTTLTQSGYKHTELGWIPEEWQFEELRKYFSFISYGFTNPMPTTVDGIFMITANDINDGKIKYSSARKTSEIAFNTLLTEKSKPKENDILLTKDGSLGRIAIVSGEKICINQSVAVIRPNYRVFPLFLKLLLEGEYYQKTMIDNAGGSTIKHIYITVVDKMKVGVPPTIDEQQAIANALSDMDAYIRSLEQLIEKKKAIKQAAMQELLTPKEDWEVRKIGDLMSITTGSKNTQDKVEDGQFPFFVRSQTVERINTYSFDGEAVLTAGDGVGTGKVFHYINGKFDLHQRVYLMSNFEPNHLDGFYFYLYFSANFFSRIMQMTAKSSVDSVRREMISNMKIPLPPIQTQKEVSDVLKSMEIEISLLEVKLEKSLFIKQGMMQDLLTGKVRLV